MSVLSQVDLRSAVQRGDVAFDPPLEEAQWGEASIDLRLGRQFTMFKDELTGVTISVAKGLQALGGLNVWRTKVLKERDELGKAETLKLEPRMFVLALTYENFCPTKHDCLIEGRSTYRESG